ncbi:MAG: DUF3445 domain-containing protein [Leptolyngbyaceae cyanobacterium bins.302]|nr:DUF3445 domain-containing protein [Leptolyngbyaceae cyanobacterium bins.302]
MMQETIVPLLAEAKPIEQLDRAAVYFPLANGRYEVKPGLVRFGTDFGNGEADQQVFQIDDNFAHYCQVKQQARRERLSKYVQTQNFTPAVERAIAQFMVDRLVQDHPQIFHLEQPLNYFVFQNQLTQERLIFNQNFDLQEIEAQVEIPYVSALDALVNQVQDDVTIVSRAGEQHWISAIHLCFPNHWSAEEKIGREFARVHEPVAGMEAMNRRGVAIVHTMITRPPTVRFSWGISTDTRLNHHPEPPPEIPATQWKGRYFNPADPRLYLRIERQVVWGFPAVDAALFSIRTYFRDCQVLKQDAHLRSQLSAAIRSMSPESLAYKGLASRQAVILKWLEEA